LSFELSHNLDEFFLHWLEVVDLVTFQQVHLIFWMIMLKDSFILQIVAFLVPLLEDKRSLVRSITCWTLSRYSKWIVQVNNVLVACWHQLLRPTCLDTVCGFAVIGVQGSPCLVKERLFQDDQCQIVCFFFVKAIAQVTEGQVQFDTVLTVLLRRILDSNKRVQEAACSAFATLEEVISLSFLSPILASIFT
jgi:hypothetical protein